MCLEVTDYFTLFVTCVLTAILLLFLEVGVINPMKPATLHCSIALKNCMYNVAFVTTSNSYHDPRNLEANGKRFQC